MSSNVVVIVGSKSVKSRKLIYKMLDSLYANSQISTIRIAPELEVSKIAAEWAEVKDIPVEEFKIPWKDVDVEGAEVVQGEWGAFNRKAPLLRNNKMLKGATHLVSMWDGEDKNAESLFKYAKRRELTVRVFIVEGEELKKYDVEVEPYNKPTPRPTSAPAPEPVEETAADNWDIGAL